MPPCFSNPTNHKVCLEARFSSASFFFLVSNSVAKVICKSPPALVFSLNMNLEQSAEL